MLLTNLYNLPKSLADALEANTYDISATSNILSITRLIGSPKIFQLTKRHWNQLEEDISDRLWTLMGSSLHSVLERVSEEGRFIEKRMYIDTSTWEIVDKEHLKEEGLYIAGKPDVYEKEECGIFDYKMTSVYSVIYGKKEWETQLNCYSYLFRKLGYEVKELKIIALLKDWNKRDSLQSSDYPKIPVAVVKIPLWSFEEQDKYIKERVKLHQQYQDTKDDEIPECTEAERWFKAGAFAVYKNDNKKALRVFETAEEAKGFKENIESADSNSYRIEERLGVNRKCFDYCSCKNYCHFFLGLNKK